MDALQSGLVEITREFLLAYRLTRRIAQRFRAGELHFDEVKALAGDDEGCCLFRLKERCHALFRPRETSSRVQMRREALFDLAVGALFHESMKFRENLYQREVYGPRMRALRSDADAESRALFDEFEKILAASLMRVEEALQEMEALLLQTREQYLGLLCSQEDKGLVTRFLTEHPDDVGDVFPGGLDRLLADIHGDAASGHAIAARSYLDSGFFEEGRRALAEARQRDPTRPELDRHEAYAEGMAAYLAAHYDVAVERMGRWLDATPPADEGEHVTLALAAIASVTDLAHGEQRERIAKDARALAARIRGVAAAASP